MKVFLSWSGERSKAVAHALRDWIPLVLHYVEPWLSEADIDAGERWAQAIAKELEATKFGVICVTRDNIASPWILFEAGALAKSMQDSRVIPVLLDLEFRDITGPLAQFQAKKAEKAGLSEVIHSINQAAGNSVPEARAKQLFDALWPQLEDKLGAVPKHASPAKHTRSQHEVLEELVAGVRTIDSRLREQVMDAPRPMRHRKRIHPIMIHDIAMMLDEKPGGLTSLLVLASMFRDHVPWVYELGIDAFRTAKYGSSKDAAKAIHRFRRAVDLALHGPFHPEELGMDMKTADMLLHEARHITFDVSVDPEFPSAPVSARPPSSPPPAPKATEAKTRSKPKKPS